jgi:hypothetical protein
MFEMSVPWESVRVKEPQAGKIIGFEAGRGIGGNSFMDLTGRDPDVAANLLPVSLVDQPAAESAESAANAPVFLEWQIDSGDKTNFAESISPDREHFWLDLLQDDPFHFTAGTHSLWYAYAGENPEGESKIDAFYLQPVVAERTFAHPDGRIITLTYNTLTGEATWIENK